MVRKTFQITDEDYAPLLDAQIDLDSFPENATGYLATMRENKRNEIKALLSALGQKYGFRPDGVVLPSPNGPFEAEAA